MEATVQTIYEIGHAAERGEEPVFRNETARMFHSNFLEFFSRVHPAVPAVIYVPVVLWFAWQGAQAGGFAAVPWFVFGLFFWSLLEYTLHRFLFHLPRQGPITDWLFMTFHGVHHMYPDDDLRLVMVPSISIPLAFVFGPLFAAVLPAIGWQLAFAGLVTGYLSYDYSHWATHFLRLPRHPLLKPLAHVLKVQKRRHMKHHFDDHDHGYGVSTALWDHVFGTVDPGLRR